MLLKDNPILMQLKQKSIDEKKSRGEYVEEDTAKVKVRSENKEHREHRIRQNIQKVKISADANSTMEQGLLRLMTEASVF